MCHVLRAGLVVSALLTAPLATAATSAALPLEPRPSAVEQPAPEDAGLVCTMQYPPTPLCWLSSLSASVSPA